MLKDITLGQYFPGESVIHKLDPRFKILFTIFYIVTVFLAKSVEAYVVVAVFILRSSLFLEYRLSTFFEA